jgi:hypothetical protein
MFVTSDTVLPVQALAAPQYKSDTEWAWVNLAVPQPQLLLGDLHNKWAIGPPWSELQGLLEVVESDPDLRYAFLTDAAGKPVSNGQWWLANNIRNFFADYFRSAGHELWMGGRSHFDDLIETLLMSIHRRRSRRTLWSPLYGSALDREGRYEFSSGISIEEPPAQVLIRIAGPLVFEPVKGQRDLPAGGRLHSRSADSRNPGGGTGVLQGDQAFSGRHHLLSRFFHRVGSGGSGFSPGPRST